MVQKSGPYSKLFLHNSFCVGRCVISWKITCLKEHLELTENVIQLDLIFLFIL